MKILVICQYYYPEPFRITDICEELAKRGHEISVLTGEPNYPEGVRYQGYFHGEKDYEIINGVKVHRCYTVPRKGGSIKRLLNYYSYAISSANMVRRGKCKTIDGNPYDVVFVNQLSPVMMATAGIVYKKKYKVPLVLYCLDIWPESLIAGGIGRNSIIYRYFHKVSKKIYKSADRVLVTSRMFSKYLNKHFDIPEQVIGYLPQYAEELFEPLKAKDSNGYTDLMFAGNIGEIQSLDTVISAADKLRHEKVRFHIVGGGTDLNRIKGIVRNKKLEESVMFYGRQPLNKMRKFYEMADAMLVTLKADSVVSLTLPGKVQTYMSCRKPIIGAIDGETSKVINESGCGYCAKAEDADGLADIIMQFCRNNAHEEMADKSLAYYKNHFEKKNIIDQLEKTLKDSLE